MKLLLSCWDDFCNGPHPEAEAAPGSPRAGSGGKLLSSLARSDISRGNRNSLIFAHDARRHTICQKKDDDEFCLLPELSFIALSTEWTEIATKSPTKLENKFNWTRLDSIWNTFDVIHKKITIVYDVNYYIFQMQSRLISIRCEDMIQFQHLFL